MAPRHLHLEMESQMTFSIKILSVATLIMFSLPVMAQEAKNDTVAKVCTTYETKISQLVAAKKSEKDLLRAAYKAANVHTAARLAKERMPEIDYASSNVGTMKALRNAITSRVWAARYAELDARTALVKGTKKTSLAKAETNMATTLVYAFGGKCPGGVVIKITDLPPATTTTVAKKQ